MNTNNETLSCEVRTRGGLRTRGVRVRGVGGRGVGVRVRGARGGGHSGRPDITASNNETMSCQVRTRGGLKTRGVRVRGVRGRGVGVRVCGARRGDQSKHPDISASFVAGLIENKKVKGLSFGKPLESPLHAKRQRLFVPSMRAHLHNEEISSIKTEGGTTSLTPSTSTVPGATPSISSDLTLHNLDNTTVPAPVAYVTCGGDDLSPPQDELTAIDYQQPLREVKKEQAVNYGSEDDSDADEDLEEEGFGLPATLSRVQRTFFDDVEELAPSVQEPEAEPELTHDSASPSSLRQIEPSDLFKFEWRPFPNPPVPPTERREVFSEINCGPTATYPTPYDAFVAIWDRDFMEYITKETNKYAQEVAERLYQEGSLAPKSRIADWHDTNVDELYVFFALILATGICIKTDMTDYWAKGDVLSTPHFGQYMCFNRFNLLNKCLHFNSNSSDLSSLSRSQAKLFKISPVIDHLNMKFQSLYRLGRNIALDESLTQWKGWLSINQFIRNKAASVGIKTYEVCEAQTGYLWRFKVYSGRTEPAVEEMTPVFDAIPTLVLELLKGLENKGRTVWMDNYYNSPQLARVLKSIGFDCVGTLRTNRKGVPSKIADLKKNDMAVGQVTGCTSGDVDILVWRDLNRVALISTYHGNAVYTVNERTKPIAIHDYNLCMGGVDKKDQMLSMYPIERKRTQVWYKKFFRRLLNVSVLNSFILHKSCQLPASQKRIIQHRSFRKILIQQILSKHKVRDVVPLSGASKSRLSGISTVPNVPIFTKEVLRHFPQEYGIIPGSTRLEKQRRSCVICKKRVPLYCPACNVPLCLGCTKTFHS